MGAACKFLIVLMAFVAVQEIAAWPFFFRLSWEDLNRDMLRAINDAEMDLTKDVSKIKNKMSKEALKMLKKTKVYESVTNCISKTESLYSNTLEEASAEAISCLDNLRPQASEEREGEPSWLQYITMKDNLKRQAKGCRESGKNEFKSILNEFVARVRTCQYVN